MNEATLPNHDHKRRCVPLADEHIRLLGDWYDAIAPVHGNLFRLTQERGVSRAIDLSKKSGAHFRKLNMATGQQKKILFSRQCLSPPLKLFSVDAHESVHAMQSFNSAAMNMHEANLQTDVVLCPLHCLWLFQLLEEDAYAKQFYIMHLLAQARPELRDDISAAEPLSSSLEGVFEKYEASLALFLAGRGFLSIEDRTEKLHGQTVKTQQKAWRLREDRDRLTYVRLADQDIIDIGSAFGPSSFGPDDDHIFGNARKIPVVSASVQRKIDRMNKCRGIQDVDALPTIGNFLESRGHTRQSALACWLRDENPFRAGPPMP